MAGSLCRIIRVLEVELRQDRHDFARALAPELTLPKHAAIAEALQDGVAKVEVQVVVTPCFSNIMAALLQWPSADD